MNPTPLAQEILEIWLILPMAIKFCTMKYVGMTALFMMKWISTPLTLLKVMKLKLKSVEPIHFNRLMTVAT